MAKILSVVPKKQPKKHRFAHVADGRIWKLTRHRDFRGMSIVNVRAMLYRLGRELGTVARTAQPDDDTLIVQIRPRGTTTCRPHYDW